MPKALPTGTVTFLFTDIEGSTRLLQAQGQDYPALLEQHAALIRQALRDHHGTEVSTEGDAFFAVFPSATDAVAAATAMQRALAEHPWPAGNALRVRMGLHTGDGRLGGDNYVGLGVHRAARIAAAAHGGQVLLSDATRALAATGLPDRVTIRDLGRHRLKDLDVPELLFQLRIDGLPADFPAPRATRLGNLPTPATSFVGRADERSAVRNLLDDGRLVTLIGPGGAGKTRLALEVARERSGRFTDGAYFVPLDVVAEPELVPSAIAQALALNIGADADPLDALRHHLSGQQLLLVLDNFEQILPAATAVDGLLSAADRLRILVTSRAALGLYGEQLYPVPPLAMPDPGSLPPLEQLSQYESVALFIARARAVQPAFSVTNDNAPAVAQICADLDGLPLAIELAAARVRLLPPEAIVPRLGSRLELLASSAGNLPARQRTLRGAIAWSYDLLTEPHQRLFERLSVFAGGCDFESAESVCNPEGELGADVLEGLGLLVDNSIVRQRERAGEARFSLLETIREFGLERLAERGDTERTRQLHADHFLRLVEDAEPYLYSAADERQYARVGVEYDNIRAALRSSLEEGNAERALRIISQLWRWWQREGLLAEGRWWCEEVVNHPAAAARSVARAKGLAALGSVAYWQGDQDAMVAAYEESLEIARERSDPSGIAWGLFNLGFTHILRGEVDRGGAMFADALSRFREIGDERGTFEALFIVGYTELLGGNIAEALPRLEESLRLTGEDWVRRADALIGLGQAHRQLGDLATARGAFSESLELAITRRDMGIAVGALEMLGAVDIARGPAERGGLLLGAAQALRQQTGGGPPQELMFFGDVMTDAAAALGAERLEALLAEGRALSLEEAARVAAADTVPTGAASSA